MFTNPWHRPQSTTEEGQLLSIRDWGRGRGEFCWMNEGKTHKQLEVVKRDLAKVNKTGRITTLFTWFCPIHEANEETKYNRSESYLSCHCLCQLLALISTNANGDHRSRRTSETAIELICTNRSFTLVLIKRAFIKGSFNVHHGHESRNGLCHLLSALLFWNQKSKCFILLSSLIFLSFVPFLMTLSGKGFPPDHQPGFSIVSVCSVYRLSLCALFSLYLNFVAFP